MTAFLTCIVPTIGRPSLTRAVKSVLNSDFRDAPVEVVVVNDSGKSLPPADWQSSERVRILHTNQRERCFARNAGAAIATGKYLSFLDDDDWLLPTALAQFWELSKKYPDAVWLYGGIQIVDEEGTCLAEMNSGLNGNCFAQIMGGAWAPIQSSCIRSDAFFASGGYRTDILGTEDLDLCRRIALRGHFANSPHSVACLFRGVSWDTSTNYLRAPADTKASRDDLLDEPEAFQQFVRSADFGYWYGRMLRVYLSTVSWNLQQQRYLRALNRVFYVLAAIFISGRYLFAHEYWDGVRAHHAPNTLHHFMNSLEEK
jgi:glycosyltransferase involved in cell wall biosynthesis